jgi:hypothetical protein
VPSADTLVKDIILKAVGVNREPREPREKKEPKGNSPGPKTFPQWMKGDLFKSLCWFAYFVYFAVSPAEFRIFPEHSGSNTPPQVRAARLGCHPRFGPGRL